MKETYFKFYDELPYPVNEWAKANFDEMYEDVENTPDDSSEAVVWGFDWESTEQGRAFWNCVSKGMGIAGLQKRFPNAFSPTYTSSEVKEKIREQWQKSFGDDLNREVDGLSFYTILGIISQSLK